MKSALLKEARELVENTAGLYAAFMAKDARFDGRFFVGISSTGIYCRPVCRAKQPKEDNCTFYNTAAEAEQAGFRPCLLCRPELAPGKSITDATASLAHRAARMLEENCGSELSLEELAGRLGCTGRHLRRVFMAEYNVSPVQYLQTCRLLLAKNLLTDTNLSVLEAAMASGFGSLRRFNDVFKKHYHLAPTALRKKVSHGKQLSSEVNLALGYRPPYSWEEMLSFLAGRAIAGVDMVKNGEYMRTVQMLAAESEPIPAATRKENYAFGEREATPGCGASGQCTARAPYVNKNVYGWVRVGHKQGKNVLSVTVSETLLPVLPQVLARVRHLFDLYCDPVAVYETLQCMGDIRPGLCVQGIRLPGCFDPFEMSVRAVLGQQITVKAASTLAARVARAYGTPVQTGVEGLTHVFPTPEDILALKGPIEKHLGPLGIIATRARTIYELASSLKQGNVDLSLPARPEDQIKNLMDIRGIGSWTAQYIAMRALEWPDAFLETDAGIKKALPGYTPKELLAMAEAWRPWRSYATMNLWNSLVKTSSGAHSL